MSDGRPVPQDRDTLLRSIEDFERTLIEYQSNNVVLASKDRYCRDGSKRSRCLPNELGDPVLIAMVESSRHRYLRPAAVSTVRPYRRLHRHCRRFRFTAGTHLEALARGGFLSARQRGAQRRKLARRRSQGGTTALAARPGASPRTHGYGIAALVRKNFVGHIQAW